MKKIKIKDFFISNENLTFICGPCVIEDEKHTLYMAEQLQEIFSEHSFNLIFKASFDKANRSSINSYRGPGINKGLEILQKVKSRFSLPVISDIHLPNQADKAKEVLDMIQIPAFLCRQTDLLLAAGKTKKPINIKKGQFLSPWEIKNVIDKILTTNNDDILLTDRGTFFGYNNLVTDFRSLLIMKSFGFPVCFDATHSIQLPGGNTTSTGGQKEFSSPLAKASVVIGVNALFIECHNNPSIAKCDKTSVMSLENLKKLLKEIKNIYTAISQEHILC